MAQGFDKGKATSDLKQLLNLDPLMKDMDPKPESVAQNSADASANRVIKKAVRKKGKGKDNTEAICEAPVQLNAGAEMKTSNSNGNALLPVSNTLQSDPSRTESSIAGNNSKDSKGNPSTKSKSKKKKEPKQLNVSDNANTQQQSKTSTPHEQEKVTPVTMHAKSNSSLSQTQGPSVPRLDDSSDKKTPKDEKAPQQKTKASSGHGDKGKDVMNTSKALKQTKLGDEELPPEFLSSLELHHIHVLKKRNQRFPKAKFFCRLCDYHLDRKEDCEKHMVENRHCRRKEVHEVDAILKELPSPTTKQLKAIDETLDKIDTEHGISEDEKSKRLAIVRRLENILQEKIPDVLLYMYGTSLTRMGLNTGDINIDLNSSDKNKKLTHLLRDVHEVMKDNTESGFSHVHSDFSATVPALLLTDEDTGFQLTVTIHCYSAHCSSELMALYTVMDDRVRKLCVAFRYWAHVCGLDRQVDGYIPPIALNIMVIYFLQNLKPALVPVIVPPRVSGEETGDFRQDKPTFEKLEKKVMVGRSDCKNKMSIGELWLCLLEYYSIRFDAVNNVVSIRSSSKLPRNTKPWNFKKLAVEDPYMTKKNITRMVNNSRIYEFWQDCIRKAYHYFGLPRDKMGRSLVVSEELKQASKVLQEGSASSAKSKQGEIKETVSHAESSTADSQNAQTFKSKQGDHNAKDSQSESSSGDSQSSQSKVVVPTHPLLLTSNPISNSSTVEASQQNSDDERNSEARSHTNNEALVGTLSGESPENVDAVSSVTAEIKDLTITSTQGSEPSVDTSVVPSNIKSEGHIIEAAAKDSKTLNSSIKDGGSADVAKGENDGKDLTVSNDSRIKTENDLPPCLPMIAQVDCFYDFLKDNLTDGKGPSLWCTACEKEGHLKNACPEDELPAVLPLSPMTKFHHKVLEETINKVPFELGLSNDCFQDRQYFIHRLEGFIKYQYHDAELQLFGSSCNGFGFRGSDMDICMTLARRGPNIDKVTVIEKLAHMLRQFDEVQYVQAISTAKVPIVKFTVRGLGLEGDISLYNTLAQENTRLLFCYSKIDPRVKALGFTIKTFAKICDIGDASRGSLSSYAYILMMLYYLQQVKPAVIPVLQELYQGDKKPVHMVEGCDAWFMDTLERLPKLWPEMGSNKMSVAELWIGFLRFYVEEFNYKEFVVCIRQKELLTRFDKLWNGSSVAIEDPFDLSHNLGSGLTRTMNNFIFKTFINGRMLYGNPIDESLELFYKYRDPSDYFFDPELLSESRPPNVRGCRRCGKIGHMVRHCPANKKEKDDEQKNQQSGSRQSDHPSQSQQSHHQQPRNQQQQQHHHQYQQQQQYRQTPKNNNQHQRQSHQQQRHMEKDWRDRDYRQNSSNNNNNINNNTRVPSSDPSMPLNMLFNNNPGLVPSMPRGVTKSHNAPDQMQQRHQHHHHHHQQQQQQQMPPQSHPMPIPNRFPSPHGSGPGPNNSPRLPPSLLGPRPTVPGGYYAPFSDPLPRHPNYRMNSPPGFYQSPPASAPPNFTGVPPNMQSTLNPVVQSLFASTQGKVMDVGSMVPKNQKKKM